MWSNQCCQITFPKGVATHTSSSNAWWGILFSFPKQPACPISIKWDLNLICISLTTSKSEHLFVFTGFLNLFSMNCLFISFVIYCSFHFVRIFYVTGINSFSSGLQITFQNCYFIYSIFSISKFCFFIVRGFLKKESKYSFWDFSLS